MKNTFKNILGLTTIYILFILVGCEKDLYEEPIKKDHKVRIEKISLDKMISEVQDPNIINYLGTLTRDAATTNANKLTEEEYQYFEKLIKENEYTTYLLKLNSYNTEKPYFLQLVIKKDSISEKAGFIKYIPYEASDNLDIENFNGKIEVYNLRNHKVGDKYFSDGEPVEMQSEASGECHTTMYLIQHNCTHGGDHAPGTPCNSGNINDGYYELVTDEFCLLFPEDLNFTSAPDISMGEYTGGGGGALTAEELRYKNFLNSLNEEQTNILATTPGLIDYVMQHGVSEESISFAWTLINLSISNHAKFEINNSPVTNSIVLNDVNELADFIISNEGESQELEGTEFANQNNNYIATYRFGIGRFGGVNALVKFHETQTGSPLTLNNVTSTQYGALFGTWTQDSYTANPRPNHRIKIDIYGNLLYDFTIEGVGIKCTNNYHLMTIIDAVSTGVESSSWSHN